MLILYLNFIPCFLLEVAHRAMIGYNLRCSKVINYPTRDSPLPIKGEYTYDLLLGSLLGNIWLEWKCHSPNPRLGGRRAHEKLYWDSLPTFSDIGGPKFYN